MHVKPVVPVYPHPKSATPRATEAVGYPQQGFE